MVCLKGPRRSGSEGQAGASQRARLAHQHHAKGYSFRKQGNFAAAIEEYSQAIALEPHHFKALFNRGFSWDKVHSTPPVLCMRACAVVALGAALMHRN